MGWKKVVRLKTTSEGRVCLELADVKRYGVPYFGRSDAESASTKWKVVSRNRTQVTGRWTRGPCRLAHKESGEAHVYGWWPLTSKLILCVVCHSYKYTVWVKKNPPCGFLAFIPKWLGICTQFFTHLLHVHIYARLQIFIQLSPILTKLCHTKWDHPSKFWHFTSTLLVSLHTGQMTSLLTSCHIQHVCWHHKSSRSGMTCHK